VRFVQLLFVAAERVTEPVTRDARAHALRVREQAREPGAAVERAAHLRRLERTGVVHRQTVVRRAELADRVVPLEAHADAVDALVARLTDGIERVLRE